MLPLRMFRAEVDDHALHTQFGDIDRRRRHSILKLGLMACFALLLIDALRTNDAGAKNLRSAQAKKNEYESVSVNDSLYISNLMFGKNYSLNMKRHMNTSFKIDPKMRDANDISGIFKGEWHMEGPPLLTAKNASIIVNNSRTTADSNVNDRGKLLIQLKSVVIANLPCLRYVYGVMRVYATPPSTAGDMLIPVQGLFEVETNTMTLLSTPLKTQFIAISAGDAHKNVSRLDYLWSNVTALHDDIRRKHDQRMQTHTAYVNETGVDKLIRTNWTDRDHHEQLSGSSNVTTEFHRRLLRNDSDTHTLRTSRSVNTSGINTITTKLSNSSDDLKRLYNTRAGVLKKTLQSRWMNRTAHGKLQAHFGTDGLGLDINRVELDDIFSGRVSKLKGLPLGVEVLTDTYHNLQDQAFMLMRKNKFSECFMDSIMRFSIAPNKIQGESFVSSPYRITNSAKLSGQVYSRDCPQFLNMTASVMYIHFDQLEGKAEIYGGIATLTSVVLIVLLVLQMKHSSSQAGFAKISYLCICAQGILDAVVCIGHMLLCAAIPSVFFFHFIWVAILSLLLFSVFEMKTVINIFQARYSGEDFSMMRRRLTSLQTKFYCILMVVMGCIFLFQHWPIVLVFLLYSVWVPQIVHSAKTGVRKPLLDYYYIGTGVCRLYIPLYILGCPENIFSQISDNFRVDVFAVLMLVLWTGLQLTVLYLQDKIGPRFFVPESWLPEHYNYCRVIPPNTACTLDKECTICYTDVDVSKRDYMITPCDHLFHRQCLTQWVDIKLECPVCRASLPAVDFVWTNDNAASTP